MSGWTPGFAFRAAKREEYQVIQLQGTASSADVPALPLRPLQEWGATIGTPHEEIEAVSSKLSPADVQSLVVSCERAMAAAADEWALGDPQKPATDDVFKHLARLLDSRGLLPWWGEIPGVRP